MTWWLTSGLPRQFMVMKANSRCYDLVPFAGAGWQVGERDPQPCLVGKRPHMSRPSSRGSRRLNRRSNARFMFLQWLPLLPQPADKIDLRKSAATGQPASTDRATLAVPPAPRPPSGTRRGLTPALRISPVTSQAAPTRPAQAPEHRMRRNTWTYGAVPSVEGRKLSHGKGALAVAPGARQSTAR